MNPPPATAEARSLDTSIRELYEFVLKENESLGWLRELAIINFNTAQPGLAERDRIEPALANDLEKAASLVRKYILSGAGLRMNGAAVPVTGVAGSGNPGRSAPWH